MTVPEALIGAAFGFWMMRMMAGKTCYVCPSGGGLGQAKQGLSSHQALVPPLQGDQLGEREAQTAPTLDLSRQNVGRHA